MPLFFIFFRILGWTDNNDPAQSRVTEPAALRQSPGSRAAPVRPCGTPRVHYTGATETFNFEAQLFSAVNTNKNNPPEWPK